MLALLVLLTVGAYLLYFSSVFGVGTVRVEGTRTVAAKTVIDAAAIPAGDPLMTLDTDGPTARVAKLPKIATVQVRRSWPSSVLITVTERTPAAVLRAPDGIKLIDPGGVPYDTVPAVPDGLPELVVAKVGADDPATQAAMRVLTTLPAKLRAEVLTVTARSPNDVRLGLTAGREARWGDAEQSDRKGQVLLALLTQPGKIYNVASPDLPTIA